MAEQQDILVGKGEAPVHLLLRYANRHGLIAGATGTGKTVTLQSLAESFSSRGVPVFLVDVKGDLSGLCMPGSGTGRIAERAKELALTDHAPRAFPVVFWDVLGEQGHPIRTTISEMGPLLLARLLELNDTQEGVLHVAFAVADDQGMLLLDLKDLRAMLSFVADNAKDLQNTYGNIGANSVGAIQRKLLVIERDGGEAFFGEPALDLQDLMRCAPDGSGVISILAADKLINRPRLYSTFLLWLLSELFEVLPEVGDRDKPKLVLFFDEAHLLFEDAPKALLDKIEQVVRLIRSKSVGVYFISQSPTDLPEDVLAQLSNRVQHALRAFTVRDQKAVKAAATTFRANPAFATEQVITELAVGEALVSTLEAKGTPGIVQRALIAPPCGRVGPATPEERAGKFAPARSPAGTTNRSTGTPPTSSCASAATRPPRTPGRSRRPLRRPRHPGTWSATFSAAPRRLDRRAGRRGSATAPPRRWRKARRAASAAVSAASSSAASSARCCGGVEPPAAPQGKTPMDFGIDLTTILHAESLTAIFTVVLIDIALAGDNAIVVGMAAAGLPAAQRRRRRSSSAWPRRPSCASSSRSSPCSCCRSSACCWPAALLLLWVAWKLWRELQSGALAEEAEGEAALEDAAGPVTAPQKIAVVGGHPDHRRRRLDVARQRARRRRRRARTRLAC